MLPGFELDSSDVVYARAHSKILSDGLWSSSQSWGGAFGDNLKASTVRVGARGRRPWRLGRAQGATGGEYGSGRLTPRTPPQLGEELQRASDNTFERVRA